MKAYMMHSKRYPPNLRNLKLKPLVVLRYLEGKPHTVSLQGDTAKMGHTSRLVQLEF